MSYCGREPDLGVMENVIDPFPHLNVTCSFQVVFLPVQRAVTCRTGRHDPFHTSRPTSSSSGNFSLACLMEIDLQKVPCATQPSRLISMQGASAQFNPTLDRQMIDRARETDPEASESEWGGGFRSDIAAFLDDACIEKVTDYSRPLEIPPRQGVTYHAFADPSGGRRDSFALAIGHKEGTGSGIFHVCDVLRGRYPPFDPELVVAEYCQLLRSYRIHTITGDAYGAAWVETAFTKQGIRYIRSEWLIPLTQVALDVVCREVGRVRSPGRTHDGQGALAFRIPEGIF